MLPFFRKIRWRLAQDNQFFKYSRYAIGEILLVVIGILIALYINNWNQERKEKERFDIVLSEVEAELITNIMDSRNTLNYMFRNDSLISHILHDNLQFEDYKKNPFLGRSIIGSYIPPLPDDAFKKLINVNAKTDSIQETILKRLKQIYTYKEEIADGGEKLSNFSLELANSYQEFSWFKDFMLGIPNTKYFEYLAENPKFKKHALIYARDQLRSLRLDIERFDIRGRMVYRMIYDYLEERKMMHDDSLYFQYDPNQFKHYTGVFIESEWDDPDDESNAMDSIVISIENNKLFFTPYFPAGNSRREIIPINKYKFRTEFGRGFYRLKFDEKNNVIEHIYGDGLLRIKSKKVR